MWLEIVEHEGRKYVRASCSMPPADEYDDSYDEEAVICLKCGKDGKWYNTVKHDKTCHSKQRKKKVKSEQRRKRAKALSSR
jgi:hypothetical protein